MRGGDGLGGLAEPHVVRDHQPARGQEALHAFPLVGIELALQRVQGLLDGGRLEPAADKGRPPLDLVTQQGGHGRVGHERTAAFRGREQGLGQLEAAALVVRATGPQGEGAVLLAAEVHPEPAGPRGRVAALRHGQAYALHPVAETSERADGVPGQLGHPRRTRAGTGAGLGAPHDPLGERDEQVLAHAQGVAQENRGSRSSLATARAARALSCTAARSSLCGGSCSGPGRPRAGRRRTARPAWRPPAAAGSLREPRAAPASPLGP